MTTGYKKVMEVTPPKSHNLFRAVGNNNINVQHCWAWISLRSGVTIMLNNIVDNIEQYGQ